MISARQLEQHALDAQTIKAFAHPLRVRLIAHLREAQIASPAELAKRFDVPIGAMSYHMRRLQTLGFVHLVRRTPRRGAIEHHYALAPDIDERIRGLADSLIDAEQRREPAINA